MEEEMFNRGRTRFFANVNRLREQKNEGGTSYGKMLLKRGIEPLAKAIDEFVTKAKTGGAGRRHMAVNLLDGMDVDVAAFITLRTAIDRLTRGSLLQGVAVTIGREIEAEQRLTNLKENDAARYQLTQRYIQGHSSRKYRSTVLRYAFGKSETVDFEPWPEVKCLHLGQKLIELARDSTGFFEIVPKYDAGFKGANEKLPYQLVASARLNEWINQHLEKASIMYPDYMPTLIPPKTWEGASGGGYYFREMRPLNLVKTADRDYLTVLDKKIQNGEMPDVLTAINALQNTPWAINGPVYDVARHLWDHTDGGVADMPPRDGYRLPVCPVCGADITDSASARVPHACLDTLPPDALKKWKRAAAVIREKNISCMSRRLGIAKTLNLAGRYKDEEAFYYPYQLDFRGRIYAVPAYLTPQGTHLAKALLCFAQGKPLGTMAAVKWLAIHGSNTWGNDKESLDDRYSWVLRHQEQIKAVAEDPYSDDWWQRADDPWGFLAFCFEWSGYLREGLEFVSRLPVAMDGTCNGLQIFSLILRDEVGGAAVNLLPGEKPQDIYGIVAGKVKEMLAACAAKDQAVADVYVKGSDLPLYNEAVCAKFLLTLDINRKTTKRQVMVLPYGGTFDSCREYTEAWLKEQVYGDAPVELPAGHTLRAVARFLATLVWEAIGLTVIKAREAMTFLQDTAAVLNKADLPARWTTPVGFYVQQFYREQTGKRVKTRIGDSLVYLTLNESRPDKLAKPKQKSAISPNYVHSLDAAALMRTVRHCLAQGIDRFAMIHDSYGTLAADSERLSRILRSTFVELFGGDANLLELWRREVTAAIPTTVMQKLDALPAVPSFGGLNVEDVSRSLFFFA
ncbi:MAG: DNA-dependent RNA polymerase [Desulfovibrio sp.]|uniref:DNA-directed RNA polymerase n=1 Tax=Desulfovibrio sp. TaxID=885 RepID=UPI002584B670|nr:DNA-directed RNA polymerase [Desulfovibrio sp.]MCD7983752.1 DNA-dependent RNA polymerase [Desulfovibrio sp.]